AHAIEDLPWIVDGEEVQLDALGLRLAGIERQHAIVEAAGEGNGQLGHGSLQSRLPEIGSCRAGLRQCRSSPVSTIMGQIARGGKDLTTMPETGQDLRAQDRRAQDLCSMLVPGAALLLPGVSNALAARVVADLGFAAAYVTGAGIANTFLGIPDIGLVTVSELARHVAAIREAFAGPLVVDADTAFANAINVVRTVQLLERAGADALQLEDQVFPKRC